MAPGVGKDGLGPVVNLSEHRRSSPHVAGARRWPLERTRHRRYAYPAVPNLEALTMPTTGLARRLVAAALACLLTTGCGLIGNDPAAEAVEDAAVAYQVAEATNAAAAVAALDAQAAARAAVDRFLAAVQTYYDSYGYGGSSAAAAAELQAAVASGEAATAEARRTTAVSGRAHIASWEAQVAWADAALDLETDGGTVLTVAGILLRLRVFVGFWAAVVGVGVMMLRGCRGLRSCWGW